jgi:hypothetical protein
MANEYQVKITNLLHGDCQVGSSSGSSSSAPTGGSGEQGPQGPPGAAGADGIIGVDGTQGNQGYQGAGFQGHQGDLGNQGVAGSSEILFIVTVSNNKFFIDGAAPAYLRLLPNFRYKFDLSDSTNDTHVFSLSETSDGIHNSGSTYLTGVTKAGTEGTAGAYLLWDIPNVANDEMYYFCALHSNMGGVIKTTGADGHQGFQGNEGVGGHQGHQGIEGVYAGIGFQGHVGADGADGVIGVDGEQGAQGFQGYQGLQGTEGVTGGDGAIGADGPQGNQGFQGHGHQGYQGLKGDTGDAGQQGDQGDQGYQGYQGLDGAYAAFGYQGYQGDEGEGFQGHQGHQGLHGSWGAVGYQGLQGVEGAAGSDGAAGADGAVGSQGYQGYGHQGHQGVEGAAGTQGNQGLQGIAGTWGAIGYQGFQGFQGFGHQGFQGTQGEAGQDGVLGGIGPQGYQGRECPACFASPYQISPPLEDGSWHPHRGLTFVSAETGQTLTADAGQAIHLIGWEGCFTAGDVVCISWPDQTQIDGTAIIQTTVQGIAVHGTSGHAGTSVIFHDVPEQISHLLLAPETVGLPITICHGSCAHTGHQGFQGHQGHQGYGYQGLDGTVANQGCPSCFELEWNKNIGDTTPTTTTAAATTTTGAPRSGLPELKSIMPWDDPHDSYNHECDINVCGATNHIKNCIEHDPEFLEKYAEQEAAAKKRIESGSYHEGGTKYVIHLWFNVVGDTTGSVTSAILDQQVAKLNEDFRKLNADITDRWIPDQADTWIEFVWNSANITTSTGEYNGTPIASWPYYDSSNQNSDFYDPNSPWGGCDCYPIKSTSHGGIDVTQPTTFLNIWVANLSGGLLGWAQFPGGPSSTDGVVIAKDSLPTIGVSPYNLGRTAVHEVGHYLNLRHIWGDGDCTVDDLVADTPAHADPNFGCPNTSKDSCPNYDDPDMWENYMDYTNDSCMTMFTKGQRTRMLDTLQNIRTGVYTSYSCPECVDASNEACDTNICLAGFTLSAVTPTSQPNGFPGGSADGHYVLEYPTWHDQMLWVNGNFTIEWTGGPYGGWTLMHRPNRAFAGVILAYYNGCVSSAEPWNTGCCPYPPIDPSSAVPDGPPSDTWWQWGAGDVKTTIAGAFSSRGEDCSTGPNPLSITGAASCMQVDDIYCLSFIKGDCDKTIIGEVKITDIVIGATDESSWITVTPLCSSASVLLDDLVSGDEVNVCKGSCATPMGPTFVAESDPMMAGSFDSWIKVNGSGNIINFYRKVNNAWFEQDMSNPIPAIGFASATSTVIEGNTSPPTHSITVDRDTSIGTSMVEYETSDGTAQGIFDYISSSGTVTWSPGETSKTIDILIAEDVTIENDETFNVTLSNPAHVGSSASITGTNPHVVTIVNDDLVTLAFASATSSITEGDSGTQTHTITVSRTIPNSSVTSEVDYATSDGTALAGEDYVATSGTLQFGANITSLTIDIVINGDTDVEGMVDETFNVTLSNATSSVGTPAIGGSPVGLHVVTITNDDSP